MRCVLLAALTVILIAGCNKTGESSKVPASTPASATALVTVSPEFLDLGTIPQGGKKEAEVTLHNAGTEPVEITGVRSSCECFTVTPETDYIEPGQRVKATVKIDLTDDPKFIGKLGIEVTGHGKNTSTPAFFIRAQIQVQARAAS